MRNQFDKQLFELNKEIIEMGAMCEEAISSVSMEGVEKLVEFMKKFEAENM